MKNPYSKCLPLLKCHLALKRRFNILRVIKCTNYVILRQIYKSYVRSKLEVPSQVFNTNAIGLSNLLKARLKFLKIDSFKVRRLKLDIIYYHKIMHGEVSIRDANEHIPDLVATKVLSAKTRLQQRRIKILARLQIRHNSHFARLPKIYSKIPSKLTSINDSSVFKNFVNNSNVFQNIINNNL